MRTFLVEQYVPELDEAAAGALTARLKAAVDELRQEGLPLRWLRSYALVGEETYVWMLAAAERDHVSLLGERVGLELDHVVEAVSTSHLKRGRQ